MRRFRWSDGPNDFAGASPRAGAFLRSPIVDAVRSRDQAQPELLCRLGQNGEDGSWSAEDPDGNELRVHNGTGGLEIWRDPPEETMDRLQHRVAPRQVHDHDPRDPNGYDRLRAYQRLLDRTYK